MSVLANVVWFVFGGEILALFWLIVAGIFAVTIIGIPIARACLEFAKLSAFPFGKEIIRETELKGIHHVSTAKRVIYIILNIIWFPIGLLSTIIYFLSGILSFISIIGIPIGIVYVRMGQFLLFPVGARVVSKKQAYASATANELEKRGLGGSQQNVVVNVQAQSAEVQIKVSAEKQIITLAHEIPILTLMQIISKTNLEMNEAEEGIKNIIKKGLAKEIKDENGKVKYDFS
jgi:uncharacterized membrane protein YccF (DUF307 family)